MCIVNWYIMTRKSLYCEPRWYLGLGRNALVSPFNTCNLHVVINMCRLTGYFPAICGYGGNPKSSKVIQHGGPILMNLDVHLEGKITLLASIKCAT